MLRRMKKIPLIPKTKMAVSPGKENRENTRNLQNHVEEESDDDSVPKLGIVVKE